MPKLPNDVKKGAKKAAKRKGINIEVQEIDSDFVGRLTIANPIYDYVSTDGEKIPVMAGYGLFKHTGTKVGETVNIPKWKRLPFSEIGCLLRIIDTSVFGYFSIKLSFKFLIDRLPIVTPS